MMNRTQLLERIAKGENSRVEFMRDHRHPDKVARAMAAFLNCSGGTILLGVENDGGISGLARSRGAAEEWVMDVAHTNIQPAIMPLWRCVETDSGKEVGVIELDAASPEKPYKAKHKGSWITFIRVGSTTRHSTREEEGSLYQTGGFLRHETKAVPDTGPEDLDPDRIENYYRDILNRSAPPWEESENWRSLLLDSGLLDSVGEDICASVAGLLLFGKNPNRHLPQAGVTAAAFPGSQRNASTIDEEQIGGPLTPRVLRCGTVVEMGVIDRTVDFVKRNMESVAWLEGARRFRKAAFPIDAVREAVVNAVAHRDYTHEGADIEVSLYCDRMEIISPGCLPDGVTVDRMKAGVVRAARNRLLVDVLRDYGYMRNFGIGVRRRIIESVRCHSETEPDLIEDGHRFAVRLWKQ